MLSLYRSSQPFVILLIIITAGIMWIPVFIHPDLFHRSIDISMSPILYYTGFQNQYISYLLGSIMGLLIWNIIAFQISQVNARHLFMESRNFLPALIFILSSGWIPGMQQLNPALVGMIFIVMGVDRIFRSYEKAKTGFAYFDTGILMASGSLIYLPYLIFLPLTWVAIIVSRSIKFRNFSNSLFGFLTPWWILYGLVFFFRGDITNLNQMIIAIFERDLLRGFLPYQFIFIATAGLLIVIASVTVTSSPPFKKVRFTRYFIILFWIFSGLLAIYLFLFASQNVLITAMCFPFSYLVANFFTHPKNEFLYQLLFLLYMIIMVGFPYLAIIMNH